MFGIGIITIIKAFVVATIIGVLGYLIWDYRHMKNTVIPELKQEITALNLRAEVIEKAQKATDDYLKAKAKVVQRNVQERADIDKAVEAGDDPHLRDLFIQHGLLSVPKAPGGASPGRLPGGSRNLSP